MTLVYNIEFSNHAKKYLKKLDKPTQQRITKEIKKLRTSPHDHPSIKKMKGYEGSQYRLMVGKFRILYEVFDENILIVVFKIGSRGNIYK